MFLFVSVKLNLILPHQVASQETYGTLGAIVRSQTGSRQVGFLTNRHVAVDLDYPNQKMFHPLPPTLGPGVYLGAVERATSFITDELWYGIFAGINPGNTVYAKTKKKQQKTSLSSDSILLHNSLFLVLRSDN